MRINGADEWGELVYCSLSFLRVTQDWPRFHITYNICSAKFLFQIGTLQMTTNGIYYLRYSSDPAIAAASARMSPIWKLTSQ